MAINPIQIAEEIQARFRRYLQTGFAFPAAHAELRSQFEQALARPERLFRGPYLHGLAPYALDVSVNNLIQRKLLPEAARQLPLLDPPDRPLYRHQVQAIERLHAGRNVVVSSGTGSGKTLTFLAPILSEILENPEPGIHALLLYPMNALVNDQLKNLRRILQGIPAIRFGRYINVEVTPYSEKDGRRLHPKAPANEVVSREVFRTQPPHILVTNYAMLEYLLLRVDDSPLFAGPWKFLVVDEAHTYAGAKGSEVALLLRRLQSRVKRPDEPPPQCIATSATLGTADAARRREVVRFAADLFNVPFSEEDLVLAEKVHAPAEGTCEPDPAVYTDPALVAACHPGAAWTDALEDALRKAGFPAAALKAKGREKLSFEERLYEVFRTDRRALKLREAAEVPRDLPAAAALVFGRQDDAALEQLCGLVRVCSLARVPGGDARLVPCRYHFFLRGLNGAYVALTRAGEQVSPQLFLDPTNQTPDGAARTLELRACRKCGQPYLFGWSFREAGGDTLHAFGQLRDERGQALWLSWQSPGAQSEDEEDETDEAAQAGRSFSTVAYRPANGGWRIVADGQVADDELALWLIHRGAELNRCFACGGRETITPIRADAEAAQAVVADAFYRCLPPAVSPPSPVAALDYPGRGRKLLAFADSRQSAAYFAPYLENSNGEQLMRGLIWEALRRAEATLPAVDAESLARHMLREGDDRHLFDPRLPQGGRRERCLRAVVAEFCLPFGRRQSLEALALVACDVGLEGRWNVPPELLGYLTPEQLTATVQVLLASVRLLKAIDLPPPLSPNDPAFKYQAGNDAMIARGSQTSSGRGRLHGFSPERAPRLQRRAGYFQRVLGAAAGACGSPTPSDDDVRRLLDDIWTGLLDSARPVFRRVEVGRGIVGHQLRWEDLYFRSRGAWHFCPICQQWSAYNVLGICPSFRCSGRLEPANPEERLAANHYRRIYSCPGEQPVPLTAREHTAQLSPKLATAYQAAFQDGHESDEGQINVLSSSTTFELGVDLGDLEAVLLRNVPPSPANYQQRAGRAGRGIGSAAFAVTFAMPRSHDEHFFAHPPLMIDGLVRPPRIDLRNKTIYQRHLHAVLLAEFVRDRSRSSGSSVTTIGELLHAPGGGATPLQEFLDQLPQAIERNRQALDMLLPGGVAAIVAGGLEKAIRTAFTEAAEYFAGEVHMYEEAIADVRQRRDEAEQERQRDRARRLTSFLGFLQHRLDDLQDADWVTFFSDRSVLPSYAFPIYNVPLATADPELRLERDLRIALSEYVPGASIVAKGRLWRSVGIRLPWQKSLERRHYACCPRCWHVIRHLDAAQVFSDGVCPVCGHDGQHPPRRVHAYLVPSHGFTTDLTVQGEDLTFDRPQRIPASRVLFVPQQQANDPVKASLGTVAVRLDVRTTEQADFFVFNDGDDPSGLGFSLCKVCGRQVELDNKRRPKAHRTPFGKDCPGTSYDRVHLGHDFISCAARLSFAGTNQGYEDRGFWMGLLYALLGGMADALGIEANDVNGVIRPLDLGGGRVGQEVVIFDDVPGGAGHALRLEDQDELLQVLRAAHARVANCTCDASAACYTCLRSYRNQFCHDLLARGPVAEYLGRLLQEVSRAPDDDQPYLLPDRASAVRAALRGSARVDLVADQLTAAGPPETGPWHLLLQECAARPGTELRLALRQPPGPLGADGAPPEGLVPLLGLEQAGAKLFRIRPKAPPPPYALLGITADGRGVAFHWGDGRTTVLDAEAHLRPLWVNRSGRRLAEARAILDAWFRQNTEALAVRELIPAKGGPVIHTVRKGQRVDFAPIFAATAGSKIERVQLQDPYLLTTHQLDCLDDFLDAVAWQPAAEKIPFKLITHLSDGDPRNRDQLSSKQQQAEIKRRLEARPALAPAVQYQVRKYNPLHMRYVLFVLQGGKTLFYVLERGLDMEDARTGKAYVDTYILEFHEIPRELAPILRLP